MLLGFEKVLKLFTGHKRPVRILYLCICNVDTQKLFITSSTLDKENKEFNKLFETLRNDKTLVKLREERELREQTEQFWHLQLQFQL